MELKRYLVISLLYFVLGILDNDANTASATTTGVSSTAETASSSGAATSVKSNLEECRKYSSGESYPLAIKACQQASNEAKTDSKDWLEAQLLLVEALDYEQELQSAKANLRKLSSLEKLPEEKYKEKIILLEAKLQIKSCEFAAARTTLERVSKDSEEGKTLRKALEGAENGLRQVEKNQDLGKWAEVEREAQSLLRHQLPYCGRLHDMRIRALVQLKDLRRALEAARNKAPLESDITEVEYLMAKVYLSSGNLTQGRQQLVSCLQLNPDHRRCMALRNTLKEFETTLKKAETEMLLKDALETLVMLKGRVERVPEDSPLYDPVFPNLLSGFKLPVLKTLCAKQARKRLLTEAKATCTEAMALDAASNSDFYHVELGKMHQGLEELEEALQYFKKAYQTNPAYPGLRKLIEETEQQYRQKQRTKHYDVLGVRPDATPEEIKKAHSRLVRRFHPDKQRTPEEKAEAQNKMHKINAAYSVLSDKTKREQYDAGFDPDDPNAAAAHQFYQGGRGGGFGGFGGFRGGGPGGASFQFNFDDLNDLFARARGGHGHAGSGSGGKRRGGRKSGGFDFFRDDL